MHFPPHVPLLGAGSTARRVPATAQEQKIAAKARRQRPMEASSSSFSSTPRAVPAAVSESSSSAAPVAKRLSGRMNTAQ